MTAAIGSTRISWIASILGSGIDGVAGLSVNGRAPTG
jgi:hypothetical protein